MVIASLIKEKLSSTPAGVVLTTRDFGVEMRYQPALAKALNRLVLQGELQKIAKGKYYIPKKTIFGNLKPADSELVKDFLEQNGKIVGYHHENPQLRPAPARRLGGSRHPLHQQRRTLHRRLPDARR